MERHHTIEDELEAFTEARHIEALRRRFELSEEWQDHKLWHEEHGGQPSLRIWEAELPAEHSVPKQPQFEDEPTRHKRTVKVGGCDCQPRSFMELSEKGDVVAGIPVPFEVATTLYSASMDAAGELYGSAAAATGSIYTPQPGDGTQPLYK